jgi:hypothetical protein
MAGTGTLRIRRFVFARKWAHKALFIACCCFLGGIIAGGISIFTRPIDHLMLAPESRTFMVACGLLFVVSVLFALPLSVGASCCPHCGSRLGRTALFAVSCSRCRKKLPK